MHEQEHTDRKKELQAQIDKLTKAINQKTDLNRLEETKLTAAFDSADKMYSDALESYDTELHNHNIELEEYNKEYDERAHELK